MNQGVTVMNMRIFAFLLGFSVVTISTMEIPKVPGTIKDVWASIIRDKKKSEEQKIAEIQQLIKDGLNLNAKSKEYLQGFTPLMLASELGYINLVKFLLNNKADANALDNYNTTAIFYAARHGRLDIVKLLISHGANIKHVATYAAKKDNILLDMLEKYPPNLEEAVKQNRKDEFKKNILALAQLFIDNGVDINMPSTPASGSKTPIMWAALVDDWDLVRLLATNKAKLCLKDQFGNTVQDYLPNLKLEKNIKKYTPTEVKDIKDLEDLLEECEWAIIKK